ncbi:hypothetical protein [Proteus myxofaciens]|uniref:Uncharacterized protein n=1 Tax=Proteus myxofaciens ATCC 19692 TaxID=1354337 RepID=A0A198GDC0_9GAMM|nr:hypothetical protein [Proteus myxofaciens]OAT34910.1 hypothetical protein M983_0873 [Proteus myxofaciens ATCC 19692]
MNKTRQQFEEFIKFYMDDTEINNKFETANNGLNYADRDIDLMWITWQASRESLINNLEPAAWMYPVFHDDKMQFTTDAVTSENIDIHFQSHGSPFKVIPLYRLD